MTCLQTRVDSPDQNSALMPSSGLILPVECVGWGIKVGLATMTERLHLTVGSYSPSFDLQANATLALLDLLQGTTSPVATEVRSWM